MVHQGTLDQWLVRPLTFFQLVAGIVFSRLLILLIPGIAILSIGYLVAPALPVFTIHALETGIIVLPLALLLFALLTTVIGLISFWTIHIYSTFALIMVILDFLGGLMLPLSLLPKSLQVLSDFLPLRFAISDPIAAVLRPGGNLLVIVFGQFLWCFLLSLLAALLWYCGVRRYEAAGG
jgi:ABC-2 type transport system permease protein